MIKKIDDNWLIKKEFIKCLCEEFNRLKLSIYNDTIIMDNIFKINIDNDKFVSKEFYFYDSYNKDKFSFINFVDAFNRLPRKERDVFYWSFIDTNYCYNDDFIANKLNYSLGYFYTQKKKTILDFSDSIGIKTTC